MNDSLKRTQFAMKIAGGTLFFLNMLAFILLMFIYGNQSLDIFWGSTGHFAFIGTILIASALLSAIVYILPQNWSQKE